MGRIKAQSAETVQEKARNLRYKRGALEMMGSPFLMNRLGEISEAIDEVSEYLVSDDKPLLDALDGDTEEAHELRFAMSDIGADCQRLEEAVIYSSSFAEDEYDDCTLHLAQLGDKDYDDVTVGLMADAWDAFGGVTGFDTYERDYFGLLTPIEKEWAKRESVQRLMRKTKAEMIETIARSWRVFLAFFDLDQRYQHIEATMDIIRGGNKALRSAIESINKIYDEIWKEWDPVNKFINRNALEKFNSLTSELPGRMWVE